MGLGNFWKIEHFKSKILNSGSPSTTIHILALERTAPLVSFFQKSSLEIVKNVAGGGRASMSSLLKDAITDTLSKLALLLLVFTSCQNSAIDTRTNQKKLKS